jgi:hypothetical protein
VPETTPLPCRNGPHPKLADVGYGQLPNNEHVQQITTAVVPARPAVFHRLNLPAKGRIITDTYETTDIYERRDVVSDSDWTRDKTLPEVVSGHPRGTLALVILMGLLYGVGWLAMYFGTFLERGLPHAH